MTTAELIATVRAELEMNAGCVFVIDRALAAALCDRLERAEADAAAEDAAVDELLREGEAARIALIARAEAAEARVAQLENELSEHQHGGACFDKVRRGDEEDRR